MLPFHDPESLDAHDPLRATTLAWLGNLVSLRTRALHEFTSLAVQVTPVYAID